MESRQATKKWPQKRNGLYQLGSLHLCFGWGPSTYVYQKDWASLLSLHGDLIDQLLDQLANQKALPVAAAN